MLLNSAVDLGRQDASVDFGVSGSVIFPARMKWKGREVLAVGSVARRHYVCPELNFAVVGFELDLEFDDSSGGFAQRKVSYVHEFTNFKDHGNGLWLPWGMMFTAVENGKAIGTVEVTVKEMSVNRPIPAEVFKVIPDGAPVTDYVAFTGYVMGKKEIYPISAPVGHSPTAQSSRSILIAVNLLILVGIALYWMRARKCPT